VAGVETAGGTAAWWCAATRCEKTACAFLGVLCMAATMDWLKAAKG